MQYNTIGQNIIITESSSNLRALGRNALSGKWKVAIIATIIYQLCMTVPQIILDELFGLKSDVLTTQTAGGIDVEMYSNVYNTMPSVSPLSSIYILFVSGAFTLGITLFFLALFRKQQVGVTDIFLGFEKIFKAMGLMLFQGLFIALWSLLFIVPGIIAAIRYSQAFFILADDPNKGIRQCMNESKMMMKGNKSTYFCLSFSFIGWILLATIPTAILTSIAVMLYASVVVQTIVSIISTLFIIPVTVYMMAAQTGFYEILAGHLIKETKPAPIPEISTSGEQENV